MTVQGLADKCADLGLPLHRTVLAKLEAGHRDHISVPELLVLARALGAGPGQLLIPDGDEPVEVLPGEVLPHDKAVSWFAGGFAVPLLDSISQWIAELQRMIIRPEGGTGRFRPPTEWSHE